MIDAKESCGTPLAQVSSVPPGKERVIPGQGFQAIRAAHLRASVREFVRQRPYKVAPSMVVVCGLLLCARYPLERVAAVAAVLLAMVGHGAVEAWHARKAGYDLRRLGISHVVVVLGFAVVSGLTGGLTSPLWLGLFGSAIGTLYFFGRGRESNATLLFCLAIALGLGLLPPSWLGPGIAYPFNVLLAGWVVLFSLFMHRRSAFALIDAYRKTGETVERLREDVLCDSLARARNLESVGANVAHELKNPLAAVKGLVQLLARSAADERARERFQVVTAEVTRMEHILTDYLSFTRPLVALHPEPVELGAVVDDVLAVLEARAQDGSVRMERVGLGARVVGDGRRLKEALLNLISNALEATPPDGLVETRVSMAGGDAEISIRDTGRGLAPEALARLGTPFFTTREGGTGLGVVLARAVIAQHGGELRYASELGRGTTATVRLPGQPAGRLASTPTTWGCHG